MGHSKMTILALDRYYEHSDESLFDFLHIPLEVNKDALIDNIMLRCADFEVLYPDPVFMRYAIGTWSDKWIRTFIKWQEALNIEYSPLENYDRHEETHITNNGEVTTEGHTSANGSDKISAYDSDTMRDNTSSMSSGSDDSTQNSSNSTDSLIRVHGNIGVTTSQQMLQSEIDIARFNLIEQITDIFMQEFMILVY